MAKELMEIGGFITSGAEIVNHDASLSGNGTVESPLGVVPGYNETVLFVHSSVPMSTTGTVYQMSEPITNFERIKVEYCNREATAWRTTNEFFLEGTSANSTRFYTSLDCSTSTGNQQRVNMVMTYNASGNLVDIQHTLFYGNGGSVTTGNERGLGVHRVIGINRKQ